MADTAAAVEDPTVPALPLAAIDASVGEQVRASQDGPGERFWVVLSLQEAEALRGALHISRAHGGKLWADEEGGEHPLVALHSDGALLDAVRCLPPICPAAYPSSAPRSRRVAADARPAMHARTTHT